MNIKYVKTPIEEYPECSGGYLAEEKCILIKKGISIIEENRVIKHEKIHYYVDKCFSVEIVKHYLNLLWDLFDVIIKPRHYYKYSKLENIEWYWKYYINARQNKEYVY